MNRAIRIARAGILPFYFHFFCSSTFFPSPVLSDREGFADGVCAGSVKKRIVEDEVSCCFGERRKLRVSIRE